MIRHFVMSHPDERPTRRSMIIAACAAAACPSPVRASPAAQSKTSPFITVDPSGRRSDVRTIAQALAMAATRTSRDVPLRLVLEPGVYREKLTVTVPNIVIEGRGPSTVLTFGAAAGHKRPDGSRWGTGGSATLTLAAPDITLRNLTVRNDFDYIADLTTHASGGAQAVALHVGIDAARTVIETCSIEGYQDTLYLAGSTLLRDCRIAGVIDFIFGGAAALLERCTIVSRFVPGLPIGYIAAPSTPATQRNGLIFHRCRLVREQGVPDDSIFLGRPWRAGGNMSLLGMAAFVDCWMDAHVRRAGWTSMGYSDPSGTRRDLTPREARLSERASRGPGAHRDAGGNFAFTGPIEMTPMSVLGWTSPVRIR
jgi:pectinesterase